MKISGESVTVRNYITKALNGMALGLFASLIIGLILNQIGELLDLSMLRNFGTIAQRLMGPSIGAGVAYTLGAPALGIFASIITGAIGAGTVSLEEGIATMAIGEPVGAFIAALIGVEVAKFIAGRTKVDIVLVPALVILTGGLAGVFVGPVVSSMMYYIGEFINTTTELHPIPMGIVVSITMGMLLTLPISSAALAISLGLEGLAAGAALVGCATQMIGFSVMSYQDNGIGGLIAQGIGTSMLQIPNIVKKPIIWLPPIIVSGILGPVATVIFAMESNSIGAGMGTSGLVGQFGTYAKMVVENGDAVGTVLMKMTTIHFLLPGVLTLLIAKVMRNRKYIEKGDLRLSETR